MNNVKMLTITYIVLIVIVFIFVFLIVDAFYRYIEYVVIEELDPIYSKYLKTLIERFRRATYIVLFLDMIFVIVITMLIIYVYVTIVFISSSKYNLNMV